MPETRAPYFKTPLSEFHRGDSHSEELIFQMVAQAVVVLGFPIFPRPMKPTFSAISVSVYYSNSTGTVHCLRGLLSANAMSSLCQSLRTRKMPTSIRPSLSSERSAMGPCPTWTT